MYDQKAGLWNGGETLTFAASGATVPAFSGSLVAPGRVTVTAPAVPDESQPKFVVHRADDLTFNWTGGGVGKVQVYMFSGPPEGTVSVVCDFAASAGTGVVPSAVLSQLPPGSGYSGVWPQDSKTTVAGDWSVTLTAQGIGVRPGGTYYFTLVAQFDLANRMPAARIRRPGRA